MASKPFPPEEVRRIVQFLQTTAVFLNMTTDWPALHWTVEHLSACLTERLRFHIGKRTEDMAPLFETECSYIEATIKEFLSWTINEDESLGGPFSDYNCKEFWAYADYKYIAQLFQDKPAMFQVLFVPRHWWLYVESVDPVTVSVNSWTEMDGVSSHDENMQYLNLAVKACMDKRRADIDQPRADMGKNDSSGWFKTPASLTFVIPFGPHLIPVNLAHNPTAPVQRTRLVTGTTTCHDIRVHPKVKMNQEVSLNFKDGVSVHIRKQKVQEPQEEELVCTFPPMTCSSS